MIKILMLDLGDTLVRDDQVLPHVQEALQAFQSFETAEGIPLEVCLVSDYFDAQPRTQERIEALFQKYLILLNGFGIGDFFKPFDKRVTLSTHAGVRKPDARVFHLAIERLGIKAQLENCLFITENTEHIVACQQLCMSTLRFGSSIENSGVDFDDWALAPQLVVDQLATTHY